MIKNKEGSTHTPIRHPVNFNHQDFLDSKKLDDEMRRVFEVCHGCRRCFNLCDSFPQLFDFIDNSKDQNREIHIRFVKTQLRIQHASRPRAGCRFGMVAEKIPSMFSGIEKDT